MVAPGLTSATTQDLMEEVIRRFFQEGLAGTAERLQNMVKALPADVLDFRTVVIIAVSDEEKARIAIVTADEDNAQLVQTLQIADEALTQAFAAQTQARQAVETAFDVAADEATAG